jgi:L-asparagine transporter-like permease
MSRGGLELKALAELETQNPSKEIAKASTAIVA